jgi:hypothetical protein
MASRPKEARVLALLEQLATEELGDGATALEWILDRLNRGKTFVKIAAEIGERLGGPGTESGRWTPSRAWVSFIAHRMAPDADQRIAEARRKGATAIAEEGLPRFEPMPGELPPADDHDTTPLSLGAGGQSKDFRRDASALFSAVRWVEGQPLVSKSATRNS